MGHLWLQIKNRQRNFYDALRGGRGNRKLLKKNRNGFTLVELIVVIVILAILAAILIPGLLKWIDEAKEKQYMLEAKSICQAAQAEAAKMYGKGEALEAPPAVGGTGKIPGVEFSGSIHADELKKIEQLSGIEDITSVGVYFKSEGELTGELTMVSITYKSSDGADIWTTWGWEGNKEWEVHKL